MTLYNIFSRKTEHIEAEKNPNLKIVADIHEKNSLLISELVSYSVQVEFENLEVADFLVKDIAIERKTVSDFLSSMISKRLSQQLINMQQYDSKLLIIEGIEEKVLYSDKLETGISPNAIRGFLLDIIFKYKVPIIFTKNFEDTAKFLIVLAKKEERENTSMRAKRATRNPEEQKQFILEGFPGIGPANAKKLLEKFKTIKNILLAPREEIEEILGKKTANFLQLLD